jgi:hypothetical protein
MSCCTVSQLCWHKTFYDCSWNESIMKQYELNIVRLYSYLALVIQHANLNFLCTVWYCLHLWPVCFYQIFPHYLISSINFITLNIKMCLMISSTNLVWNISHSKKNSARNFHKLTYIGLQVKYLLLLSDFKQPEFLLQIFEKYSNVKFPKKSFQWE